MEKINKESILKSLIEQFDTNCYLCSICPYAKFNDHDPESGFNNYDCELELYFEEHFAACRKLIVAHLM